METTTTPPFSLPTRELLLDFFQTYGATDSRQRLWRWYRTTVSGDYHLLEPVEMGNLVQFYDALDRLLQELAQTTE